MIWPAFRGVEMPMSMTYQSVREPSASTDPSFSQRSPPSRCLGPTIGRVVSPRILSLTLQAKSSTPPGEVAIEQAVVAGWTGRDGAAVEKHIKELEALGVKRPATTPIFYRVAGARITTRELLEGGGESSRGEAEFVLLQHAGRLWVGAGSDHTDREVEKYGGDGLETDMRKAHRSRAVGLRRCRAALGSSDPALARDRRRRPCALPG